MNIKKWIHLSWAFISLSFLFIAFQNFSPLNEYQGGALPVYVQNSDGSAYLKGADPFVYQTVSLDQYLVMTNNSNGNVPMYKKINQRADAFSFLQDALPKLSVWAQKGSTWAPELFRVGNYFFLTYTAKVKSESKYGAIAGKLCLGIASSASLETSFIDSSETPFFCNSDTDTSIDSSFFKDPTDNKLYFLWKTRKIVNLGLPDEKYDTKIWMQTVKPGAILTLTGEPKLLLKNDLPWEGEHVEAPSLIKKNGTYFLFYSAGASTDAGYTVSYAVSSDLTNSSFVKSNRLLVTSTKSMKLPGHQSIIRLGTNEYKMFFHSVYFSRRSTPDEKARYIDYLYMCFGAGNVPYVQNQACPI